VRLLLDTNILIDLSRNFDASELSEPDVFELAVGRNPFLVSVVSIWEIEIKSRIGKLAIELPVEQLGSMVKASGGTLLTVSEDHILAPLPVEPNTKDPFDRLLLSTAAAEGALLVTRDCALQAHPLAWRPFPT
jgi:PIN domain nuclease of toxin-antitoxin system